MLLQHISRKLTTVLFFFKDRQALFWRENDDRHFLEIKLYSISIVLISKTRGRIAIELEVKTEMCGVFFNRRSNQSQNGPAAGNSTTLVGMADLLHSNITDHHNRISQVESKVQELTDHQDEILELAKNAHSTALMAHQAVNPGMLWSFLTKSRGVTTRS